MAPLAPRQGEPARTKLEMEQDYRPKPIGRVLFLDQRRWSVRMASSGDPRDLRACSKECCDFLLSCFTLSSWSSRFSRFEVCTARTQRARGVDLLRRPAVDEQRRAFERAMGHLELDAHGRRVLADVVVTRSGDKHLVLPSRAR